MLMNVQVQLRLSGYPGLNLVHAHHQHMSSIGSNTEHHIDDKTSKDVLAYRRIHCALDFLHALCHVLGTLGSLTGWTARSAVGR
jgi:hypothetical protein